MTIWQPTELNPQLPKYKALAESIAVAIGAGSLKPGDKLPTHRLLADRLGVTVGTVTRAYAEAEKRQLIESKVGSGTYVRGARANEFAVGEPLAEEIIDLSYSFSVNVQQHEHLAEDLAQLSTQPALLKQLLEYQSPHGLQHQREAGMAWLHKTGIQTGEFERLLITNGGQHGFNCATLTLCRAGDTVLSAGVTYPGFAQVAQLMGLRHVGLESDRLGVLPDALALACQRYKPRMIYLNTRINNPSCEQMTSQRIDDLAEVLKRFQVMVVEDDVQGCLLDPTTPTFVNRHPDITLFVTGTSKALTGGLRVGYLLPPKALVRAVAGAIRSSCWMPAPLMVEIASRWIAGGLADRIIELQCKELRLRHEMVADVLRLQQFNSVERGFNVWLQLPETRRAQEFCHSLEKQNVLVKPSTAFAVGHFHAPQAVRFCVGSDISLASLRSALEIIQQELSQPGAEFDLTQ